MRSVTDATAIEPVSLEGEAYYQDPWGFFARLRESRPVTKVRMPGYGHAWVVTRYATCAPPWPIPGWPGT